MGGIKTGRHLVVCDYRLLDNERFLDVHHFEGVIAAAGDEIVPVKPAQRMYSPFDLNELSRLQFISRFQLLPLQTLLILRNGVLQQLVCEAPQLDGAR